MELALKQLEIYIGNLGTSSTIEEVNRMSWLLQYQYAQCCSQHYSHKNVNISKLANMCSEFIKRFTNFFENDTYPVHKKFITCLEDIENFFKVDWLVEGFVPILDQYMEIILDPSVDYWTAYEIVTSSNKIFAIISNPIKRNFFREHSLNVYKLMDMLCICGDFCFQEAILKLIIRLHPDINDVKLTEKFFPDDALLQHQFMTIRPQNFNLDARIFLNVINGKNKTVFSTKAASVMGDSSEIEPPEFYGRGKDMWIDFNLKSESISFHCTSNSLSPGLPVNYLYHETVFICKKIVEMLTIKNDKKSLELIIDLSTKMSTVLLSSKHFTEKCRSVKIVLEKNTLHKELINRYLPNIFGDLLSGDTDTPTETDHQSLGNLELMNYKPLTLMVKSTSVSNLTSLSVLSFPAMRQELCGHEFSEHGSNYDNLELSNINNDVTNTDDEETILMPDVPQDEELNETVCNVDLNRLSYIDGKSRSMLVQFSNLNYDTYEANKIRITNLEDNLSPMSSWDTHVSEQRANESLNELFYSGREENDNQDRSLNEVFELKNKPHMTVLRSKLESISENDEYFSLEQIISPVIGKRFDLTANVNQADLRLEIPSKINRSMKMTDLSNSTSKSAVDAKEFSTKINSYKSSKIMRKNVNSEVKDLFGTVLISEEPTDNVHDYSNEGYTVMVKGPALSEDFDESLDDIEHATIIISDEESSKHIYSVVQRVYQITSSEVNSNVENVNDTFDMNVNSNVREYDDAPNPSVHNSANNNQKETTFEYVAGRDTFKASSVNKKKPEALPSLKNNNKKKIVSPPPPESGWRNSQCKRECQDEGPITSSTLSNIKLSDITELAQQMKERKQFVELDLSIDKQSVTLSNLELGSPTNMDNNFKFPKATCSKIMHGKKQKKHLDLAAMAPPQMVLSSKYKREYLQDAGSITSLNTYTSDIKLSISELTQQMKERKQFVELDSSIDKQSAILSNLELVTPTIIQNNFNYPPAIEEPLKSRHGRKQKKHLDLDITADLTELNVGTNKFEEPDLSSTQSHFEPVVTSSKQQRLNPSPAHETTQKKRRKCRKKVKHTITVDPDIATEDLSKENEFVQRDRQFANFKSIPQVRLTPIDIEKFLEEKQNRREMQRKIKDSTLSNLYDLYLDMPATTNKTSAFSSKSKKLTSKKVHSFIKDEVVISQGVENMNLQNRRTSAELTEDARKAFASQGLSYGGVFGSSPDNLVTSKESSRSPDPNGTDDVIDKNAYGFSAFGKNENIVEQNQNNDNSEQSKVGAKKIKKKEKRAEGSLCQSPVLNINIMNQNLIGSSGIDTLLGRNTIGAQKHKHTKYQKKREKRFKNLSCDESNEKQTSTDLIQVQEIDQGDLCDDVQVDKSCISKGNLTNSSDFFIDSTSKNKERESETKDNKTGLKEISVSDNHLKSSKKTGTKKIESFETNDESPEKSYKKNSHTALKKPLCDSTNVTDQRIKRKRKPDRFITEQENKIPEDENSRFNILAREPAKKQDYEIGANHSFIPNKKCGRKQKNKHKLSILTIETENALTDQTKEENQNICEELLQKSTEIKRFQHDDNNFDKTLNENDSDAIFEQRTQDNINFPTRPISSLSAFTIINSYKEELIQDKQMEASNDNRLSNATHQSSHIDVTDDNKSERLEPQDDFTNAIEVQISVSKKHTRSTRLLREDSLSLHINSNAVTVNELTEHNSPSLPGPTNEATDSFAKPVDTVIHQELEPNSSLHSIMNSKAHLSVAEAEVTRHAPQFPETSHHGGTLSKRYIDFVPNMQDTAFRSSQLTSKVIKIKSVKRRLYNPNNIDHLLSDTFNQPEKESVECRKQSVHKSDPLDNLINRSEKRFKSAIADTIMDNSSVRKSEEIFNEIFRNMEKKKKSQERWNLYDNRRKSKYSRMGLNDSIFSRQKRSSLKVKGLQNMRITRKHSDATTNAGLKEKLALVLEDLQDIYDALP